MDHVASKITKEDVEDYEAQQNGFDDRNAERIHWLENDVSVAKFVVTEREEELLKAQEAVKAAESALRKAKRQT